MKRLNKIFLAAFILLSASVARADLVIFNVTGSTRSMASEIANKFIIGCAIVAAAIILAAYLSRRKI